MLRLTRTTFFQRRSNVLRSCSTVPSAAHLVQSSTPAEEHENAGHDFPIPRSDPRLGMDTKRRLPGSPTVCLEAVALPHPVQSAITSIIKASGLSSRDIRKKATTFLKLRAQDTYCDKRVPNLGPPIVLPPPSYSSEEVAAFAATRVPGTYTATAYVLAELRRRLPSFKPESLLDFGAGLGTGTLAAAAAFGDKAFSQHARVPEPTGLVNDICLVDASATMRAVAPQVLDADPALPDGLRLQIVGALPDTPNGKQYDVVLASHALSEIVRTTMAKPESTVREKGETSRAPVERGAERRLRKVIKQLWGRVAPGGVMVIVEDGTAAGFEAVLFARESLLNKEGFTKSKEGTGENCANDSEQDEARVVAPCLHSGTCPLDGNVTRKRICRFVQRLNRPPFQRVADPRHDAFEDEYLSYMVIQRVPPGAEEGVAPLRDERWGRLVRAPLLKGKHITIDACTNEGKLERRVVTKKNAPDGYYHRARKSKWGDIWPTVPASNIAPVNF